MAEYNFVINDVVERALKNLNVLRDCNREIILKREQEIAVKDLLSGKDVLAILPTGFGKSLIFTLFVFAMQELKKLKAEGNSSTSVLVISPLKSIIDDQIAEMVSLNCTAMELSSETLSRINSSPPQFIYCSAEQALDKNFLNALKDDKTPLHRDVETIVVDESHTVEAWTGKRKKHGPATKDNQAFRSAYGKLSLLRSMCKEGTPVLALTGTADKDTEKTIVAELVMRNFTRLFVSPNRLNLRLSVNKVSRTNMLNQLDWIVELVKDFGKDTPKTIIFCDTMYSIASVYNYMMMKLQGRAFHPTDSTKREDCLLGIFHSVTHKVYKERLLNSLKNSGPKRVAIATTALSMGVNFPDIRYVVLFGPARSLLDLHQEAGRAGRDGSHSDVVIFYYGQQLSHCEIDVRDFLKTSGCYRVAGYSSFDANVSPQSPAHYCCNFCAKSCRCSLSLMECTEPEKAFERKLVECESPEHQVHRSISEEDKNMLSASLSELQSNLSSDAGLSSSATFGCTSSHGFSEELISDVVANCHKLFTLEDIITNVPVFSKNHAVKILEILHELFDDLDESSLRNLSYRSDDDDDRYMYELFRINLLDSEYNVDEELADMDIIE